MKHDLRISRRALRHIDAADSWWRENRPLHPSLFEAELLGALRRTRFAKKEIAAASRRARGIDRAALTLGTELVEIALAGGAPLHENPVADVLLQVQLTELVEDHQERSREALLGRLEQCDEGRPMEPVARWLEGVDPGHGESLEELASSAAAGLRSLADHDPPALFTLDEWLLLQAAVVAAAGDITSETSDAELTRRLLDAAERIEAIAGEAMVRRIAVRALSLADRDDELPSCAHALVRSPALVVLTMSRLCPDVSIRWRSGREEDLTADLHGEGMTWNALGEYADHLASEGEIVAEANVRRARELIRAYEEARIVTDGREKGDRHARG